MRRAALVAMVAATTGCWRVDATEVRVRDAHAVGVVSDANNAWLLPPGGPPETVEVYRNFALTTKLTREPSGAIAYTSSHWALGERIDTTPLLDARGLMGWTSTPGASASFRASLEQGDEIRLHAVNLVRETGPFGTCNGTQFDDCVTSPAVSMSLATSTRNVDEVRVHRTPLRWLGIGELVLGAAALGVGVAAGVVGLQSQDSDGKTAVLGLGAACALLGGLFIGNGLWRVLTPDEELLYRPSPRE